MEDLLGNHVSLLLSVGHLDGDAFVVVFGDLFLPDVIRQLDGVGGGASAGRVATAAVGLSLAPAVALVA